MNKRMKLLWGVVVVLQLAAPLYLAWRWETTLSLGRAYKFQAAPVDPYDPMRGRYVALGFAEQKATIPAGVNLASGRPAYVKIKADEGGFAKIEQVSPEMPADQQDDWIRASVFLQRKDTVSVRWPFVRYYLPERLAPEAEKAYRKSDKKNTWAVVRVHNGDAVLETLVIDGEDVHQKQ